jgi:hypothetical protein
MGRVAMARPGCRKPLSVNEDKTGVAGAIPNPVNWEAPREHKGNAGIMSHQQFTIFLTRRFARHRGLRVHPQFFSGVALG